jgi:ketosteroid isomerase-like protein
MRGQTQEREMMDLKEEIRRAIQDRIEAMARKDSAALANSLAPEAIIFEMVPPLRLPAGAAQDVQGIEAWLSSWAEGPTVEMIELQIEAEGDLGLASSLNRLIGKRLDGRSTDLWMRSTLGLRRIDGEWRIVHAHTSVPFYPATMAAATDLRPE